MLLHLGLLAVCTWVLPFCMGMLPVRYMKEEHKSFGMVWLSGWMMMFAVFEVLVVPFIVREASFSMAIQCYTVVIGILAVLFLFLGRSTVPACLRKWKEARPDWGQAMIMFLVLTLIILQLIFAFYMQYLDGDDSFFVATSLTSQHTDTMYRFTPYYGANGGLDIRHALSPEPIFMAWLSEVSGIHVTIICHSYISILFLILMYCIYGQVGSQLFPLQRKNRWLFLLFLNIWYLFGNVSIYAAESFAYTRTWQGKAMFPNLMVPLLFLWLLYMAKNEMDVGEWSMLFVIILCTVFTTSTGIFTVPILLLLAAVIMAVVQKRAFLILQTGACLVPSLFFGLLYLFLK
ncbi:MAG: hypothetical protein HFI94_02965 [Lachnospiraceae bacterium]|mgnify:CR=1 FL=1|nr:hypothetical protein [Lachnospiraceae bacterium]